jgi:ribonuclease P protein component
LAQNKSVLLKTNRLDRKNFWKVHQTGTAVRNTHLSGYVLENTLPFSRYAVVVTTKISKRAVVRNQLRRRIYTILKKGYLDGKIDVILYPKSSMVNLTDEEISTAISGFLSQTA